MVVTTFEGLTLTQQKALAICPKVGALLSMGGTVYIFLKIFASNRLNRPNRPEVVYNRLLLGLTIGDFAYALVAFLSTWPVPKDTIYSDFIWGEAGNQTTCNIQGVLLVGGGLIALMYMCCLSLYFLLIIKYKWALQRLQKIEPYMHVCCITFPLVASILGLINELYNPFIVGCGVQSYPIQCSSSTNNQVCIRGENAEIYRWFIVIIPIVSALIFIAVSMIMIYVSAKIRQGAAFRFRRPNDTSETVSEQIREDFRRAWQFTGVFILISMPVLVAMFAFAIYGKESFIIALIRAVVAPMQGFFNAIVFSRDLEGELIRSIWDSAYRTRAPAVPRSGTPQLSITVGNCESDTHLPNRETLSQSSSEEALRS